MSRIEAPMEHLYWAILPGLLPEEEQVPLNMPCWFLLLDDYCCVGVDRNFLVDGNYLDDDGDDVLKRNKNNQTALWHENGLLGNATTGLSMDAATLGTSPTTETTEPKSHCISSSWYGRSTQGPWRFRMRLMVEESFLFLVGSSSVVVTPQFFIVFRKFDQRRRDGTPTVQ